MLGLLYRLPPSEQEGPLMTTILCPECDYPWYDDAQYPNARDVDAYDDHDAFFPNVCTPCITIYHGLQLKDY